MPSATANGFPYPVGSDEMGDTDLHIKALADDLESKFFPAFTEVTFNGSWANYGEPYEEASYAKLGNVVRLRGLIKHATTSTTGTVFTLPAGYRPAKTRRLVIDAGTGQAVVTINNSGVFAIASYINGGAATTIGLEMVSFDLAA